MGAKLAKAFEMAKQEGGLQAQMRLAMKFGMSSEKANTAPDTPDNIAKIKEIYQSVLGKSLNI